MRVDQLDLKELLEVDVQGGLLRFAGQRAIIFDAVAQGLLRKELIDTFGVRVARGILNRFGYAHGQRMAEAMKSQFEWASEEDWRRAGSRIYALQGLFMLEPGTSFCFDTRGGTWRVSYEAEQHLLHMGRSDYPVCWTLCGLAGGYLSRAMDREVYAIEDKCMGMGDSACHITIKTREELDSSSSDALAGFKREDIDAALLSVTAALKRTENELLIHARKLAAVAQVAPVEEGPLDIVARSQDMKRVLELARTIAKVESNVLITGESGTGKERIARFVHSHSPCAAGPFVGVNCGAISEMLLESELFGHARGSFTGATADRPGLFEAANGGTLFLDEISEIPLHLQVKLLRALQEREVRRVGENKNRPFHVRIVASTNKDLVPEVNAQRFRGDLYYRLRVVELAIPPLRNRQEDILPLARILLADAATRMKRPIKGITGRAADRLLSHPWNGNVRELGNVMERAVAVTTRNHVDVEDLPPEFRTTPTVSAYVGTINSLADVEKQYILAVLTAKNGNRTQAAETLKIGVATLHRKLKSFKEVDPEAPPSPFDVVDWNHDI